MRGRCGRRLERESLGTSALICSAVAFQNLGFRPFNFQITRKSSPLTAVQSTLFRLLRSILIYLCLTLNIVILRLFSLVLVVLCCRACVIFPIYPVCSLVAIYSLDLILMACTVLINILFQIGSSFGS